MDPVVIGIGPVQLHAYTACMVTAVILGGWLTYREAKRRMRLNRRDADGRIDRADRRRRGSEAQHDRVPGAVRILAPAANDSLSRRSADRRPCRRLRVSDAVREDTAGGTVRGRSSSSVPAARPSHRPSGKLPGRGRLRDAHISSVGSLPSKGIDCICDLLPKFRRQEGTT